MSHWFRFYDDAINDPKILKLPEASRWHWTALLCIASKNDGVLPAIEDVALMLRVKPSTAAAIIAQMKSAGLLDFDGSKYAPHNWSGRQYKSDVSTERVKRFRKRERNVSETPPEADTDQIQNRTEADARDPDAKRLGDFCQAIVSAYTEANSPTLPDTSRAGLWLTQGYEPEICLAVIREIVRKKPNAGLAYFDRPIKEAHESKAPKRVSITPPIDDGYVEVLEQHALEAWDAYRMKTEGKTWPRNKRGGWRFPTKWPPGHEAKTLEGVQRLISQGAS